MIKINTKKILSKKAGISYLEILILLVSIFAFAFIVDSSTVLAQEDSELESFEPSIETPPVPTDPDQQVDESGFTLSCCIERTDGAPCDETLTSLCDASCSGDCIPASCETISSCQKGCCYDPENGVCDSQAPQWLCEEGGGEWSNDAACNINKCERVCCDLGSETKFVTERECEKLAEERGIEKNILTDVEGENACIGEGIDPLEKGACIITDQDEFGEEIQDCIHNKQEECIDLGGDFHAGFMCSYPDLETGCEKQDHKGCVEEFDGVYWFDSCNNVENIYSSNLAQSWNDGRFLKPADSCNPTSDNIGSGNCGNCNRLVGDGSTCEDSDGEGEAICVDLSCRNAPDSVGTKDRQNYESWCVYDSKTGEGDDVPGSRHHVYRCVEGEILVEACADYRNAICVQDILDTPSGETSLANCIISRSKECYQYNDKEGLTPEEKIEKDEKCDENPDCFLKQLNFGDGYGFNICLSEYPPGLSQDEDKNEANKAICNMANFQCVKVMKKSITGKWKCKSGCYCDTISFTEEMNEWCISIGDCGASSNVAGELSKEGYSISENGAELSSQYLTQLASYSIPIKNRVIEPSDVSGLLEDAYGWSSIEDTYAEEDYLDILMKAGGGVAGVGYLLGGTAATQGTFTAAGMVLTKMGIGALAISAVVGGAIGYLIGKLFGLSNDAMLVVIGAGVIAGIVVSIIAGGLPACFGPQALACGIAIVIVVIIAFVLDAIGFGELKQEVTEFKCETWRAPDGGVNCEICDEDPLKPCSKYKCESLGKTCEYIEENEGVEGERRCLDVAPDDNTVPVITPWEEALNEGYKYQDISTYGMTVRTSTGACIPQSTIVFMGIETDEHAQCKLETETKGTYDEMIDNYFNGDNSYRLQHTQTLYMPPAQSIIDELMANLQDPSLVDVDALEQELNELYNDINFYVRCKDKSGNYDAREFIINTCVNQGPDSIPPIIQATSPGNDYYLKHQTAQQEAIFYISEPAECKYSLIQGREYADMENTMACETNLSDVALYGWPCSTTLTGLQSGANKFYVKCKDQPWLEGEETDTEKRQESSEFIYTLHVTENPLIINSITPIADSTIYGGTEPFEITMKVQTSGGINGEALCSYSFNEDGYYITMSQTNSYQHENIWDMMLSGQHNLYVRCIDDADNIATGSTRFNLELDTTHPEVTRVYHSGGSLYVITSENSECAFSGLGCGFEFEDAVRMSGTDKTHTTPWTEDEDYFIRCKDRFDNPSTGCSIIVRTYNG